MRSLEAVGRPPVVSPGFDPSSGTNFGVFAGFWVCGCVRGSVWGSLRVQKAGQMLHSVQRLGQGGRPPFLSVARAVVGEGQCCQGRRCLMHALSLLSLLFSFSISLYLFLSFSISFSISALSPCLFLFERVDRAGSMTSRPDRHATGRAAGGWVTSVSPSGVTPPVATVRPPTRQPRRAGKPPPPA